MNYGELSKNRAAELSKLKQKKYRLQEGRVVVEGLRTLGQLKQYGLTPLEQYLREGGSPLWENVSTFQVKDWLWGRLCESEQPQGIAGLFPLPPAGVASFATALYLDGIADPGNLGTIFRCAAAFGLDALLLSEHCVEVSSPKVIRASLGSVYRVPHEVISAQELGRYGAELYIGEMRGGIPLSRFKPEAGRKLIIAIGGEAQGISSDLKKMANGAITIPIGSEMESLNAAVAAGIILHRLFCLKLPDCD